MSAPTYSLTLHKTYYDKGFFNFGVEVDRFVRKDSGPATLLLGNARVRLNVQVDRDANQNGTPRVHGGAELRNWLQQNCRLDQRVQIEVLNPTEFWLKG